jgi:imidazole glycerol-phosphate synthase subunit HisH
MNKKIAIIDYSLGNIFSIQQAFSNFNIDTFVTNDIKKIENADAIVLPGVGAFSEAMKQLDDLKLIDVIVNSVKVGKPFLGICLGMQILFEESEELGSTKGLSLISGKIKRFNFDQKNVKIPQMQWNSIINPGANRWENTVLENIKDNEFMYFVHSYYAIPNKEEEVLAYTNYHDFKYCSAIKKENITATQFHPEKSGIEGLKIYSNWIKNL